MSSVPCLSKQFEDALWAAADNLRANSGLKASEYSTPVLGLIFLKFADINYRRFEEAILNEYQKLSSRRLASRITIGRPYFCNESDRQDAIGRLDREQSDAS